VTDKWIVRQLADTTSDGCIKASRIVAPCGEYEPVTLGVYDPQVLDQLDYVMVKIKDRGMKTLISPHDGNQLDPDNPIRDLYGAQFKARGYKF
jgi:mannan endo-1,4-beta-mannosidase